MISTHRRIEGVGRLIDMLWLVMLVTVLVEIVSCYSHFHAGRAFDFPSHAFTFSTGFFSGLGSGLVVAIYDYLGYYTAAYIGDEIEDPGRTMPRATIYAILAVFAIYPSMNIGIMGVVPWREAEHSTFIGSDAIQRAWNHTAGDVVSILIIVTAFASVYAGLLGGSRLPYNAARDRLFFAPFGRLHPRLRFPHVSLLVIGAVTAIACLFTLTTIINALIVVSIIVQFIGGAVALIVLRHRQPELRRRYRQWLYPLPCLVAIAGWLYIFESAGMRAIELAVAWTALGVVAYVVWRARSTSGRSGRRRSASASSRRRRPRISTARTSVRPSGGDRGRREADSALVGEVRQRDAIVGISRVCELRALLADRRRVCAREPGGPSGRRGLDVADDGATRSRHGAQCKRFAGCP